MKNPCNISCILVVALAICSTSCWSRKHASSPYLEYNSELDPLLINGDNPSANDQNIESNETATAGKPTVPAPSPSPSTTKVKAKDAEDIPKPKGPVKIHVVQDGDYLADLAKHYGVTVDAIKKANDMSFSIIRVGMKLIIPIDPTKK